jgi:PhnB protein
MWTDWTGITHDGESIMAHPIPVGHHAITPHLVIKGASEAIEFYKKAFGAVENSRMPGPGGKLMHAQITIGDSPLMLVDEMPDWNCLGPKALKGSPVTIHLYVTDADATYAKAIAAGATAKMPPQDMFWGDRYGQVTDPFGHEWSIATHQRDLTPEQMMEGMKNMPPMDPPKKK